MPTRKTLKSRRRWSKRPFKYTTGYFADGEYKHIKLDTIWKRIKEQTGYRNA